MSPGGSMPRQGEEALYNDLMEIRKREIGTGNTASDIHRGQSLVVHAIAEGRAAAIEVDRYLLGYTNLI